MFRLASMSGSRALLTASTTKARATTLLVLLGAFVAACERTASDDVTLDVLHTGLFEGAASADPSLAIDPMTGELLIAWVAESHGTERSRNGGAGNETASMAADGKHTAHASVAETWNLWFTRSGDGGDSFAAPSRVNDIPGDVLPHAEGAPRLVTAPGVVALFWNNKLEADGREWGGSDLRFARSTDGGATWSNARSLQDPVEIPRMPPRTHTFHGAGWAADSTLVVAWIDYREQDRGRVERGLASGLTLEEAVRRRNEFADEDDPHDVDGVIYAAISHDLGTTWESANTRIQDRTCNCCRISLARTPAGALIGSWRRHFDGSVRDPVVQVVLDAAGAPSEDLFRVHEDGWVHPGCPHTGPGLDVDADGTVHVAWYTGADGIMGVHYASKLATAPKFGPPLPVVTGEAIPVAHPAVAALPDGGAVVAHNVDADGRRVVRLTAIAPGVEIRFSREVPASEGATHPQLVRLADGRIVVAWTDSHDGVQQVRIARLTLEGDRASGGVHRARAGENDGRVAGRTSP